MKRLKLPIVLLITLFVIGGIIITQSFKSEKKAESDSSSDTPSKSTSAENIIPEVVKLALEKAEKTNPANQLRKFPFPRTVRLLDYARTQKHVRFSSTQIEGKTWIDIKSIEDSVLGEIHLVAWIL